MIVNVRFVGMRCDNESMLALEKAPRHFITDTVGLLRRDLPRHECLTEMIGNHVILLCAPGDAAILFLCQKKLLRCRLRRTLI